MPWITILVPVQYSLGLVRDFEGNFTGFSKKKFNQVFPSSFLYLQDITFNMQVIVCCLNFGVLCLYRSLN